MPDWQSDPVIHLEVNRELRQKERTCFRCRGSIEGSPGVDPRRGYYHPFPGGCP